jgi:integrase
MVTVGKNDKGRPICKPLKPESYFATYNDAYNALMEYNKSPYDLDPSLTVKKVYDEWSEKYFPRLESDSSIRGIKSSWNYCSSIHDMGIRDVRARHVRSCIEEGYVIDKGEKRYASKNTKNRIKSTLNLLLDYAVEYEYVDRNYARDVKMADSLSKESAGNSSKHMSFSDEEMFKLWENVNTRLYVDVILIQCYSGWRPTELIELRLEDIDLKEWTMTGGIKSDAGINRTIPVHEKIKELVEKKYYEAVELRSDYLINCLDRKSENDMLNFSYKKYSNRFAGVIEDLGLNEKHLPHDPRKHFVTIAKRYGVDEYAIKRMIGHAIDDLTEKVYTERDIQWFRDEMKKIK